MPSLFEATTLQATRSRIGALGAASPRQWGKMTAAQAIAHCRIALEIAAGERISKQKFIFKLISLPFRKGILSDRPFAKDSPTGPELIVRDHPDLETEKRRIDELMVRFAAAGPSAADGRTHGFLGALKGDEWGSYMWKHLDHHLRQFSV
jgi:Protein of unknown function (DUF1569)